MYKLWINAIKININSKSAHIGILSEQGIQRIWRTLKICFLLGVVAHTCNLSILGTEAGRSQGQESKTSLANMMKPHLYKNTKITWA